MGSKSFCEMQTEHNVDAIVVVGQFMLNMIEQAEPKVTSLMLEKIYLNSLSGHIYHDKSERFDDGSLIQTSMVIGKEQVADGWIIQTMNTKYLAIKG